MAVVDQFAKTVAIYGLADPETSELRYVGKTNQPLAYRLSQHISHRVRQRNKCSSWIRSLQRRGLSPEMFLIEEVPSKDWEEAEQHWIGYFRFVGADLCNLRDGGGRPDGYSLSEEHKKKIGLASRGRTLSAKSREKLSASKIAANIKRDDLAARNIRNAKLTEKQVNKIRDRSFKGVDLAREFGIHPATVCDIRKGKLYRRFDPATSHIES